MTNLEIGNILGRSETFVSKHARKYRKSKLCDRLTEEQKQFIYLHHNLKDMTQKDIAKRLGLTYNSVMHYIRAYINKG
ncbi:MAG: sigma-70 region 4 domain-containing protein [Bacilli bacterium]|nr:sigma-70 region 4 domain-containing protein [Bacilli bacterium]MBQ3307629.1 sigma-70 region 4 domain-containing protein [Bacilli bacterium]MBQ3421919.1 sigma-70 region 4 domain-containing protein [Romboutsia sp.]